MKISGHFQGMMPKGRGHRSMAKERTNNIVNGFDLTFRFAILRRSVWAIKTEIDAINLTRFSKRIIVKFTTIIALKSFNAALKLGTNICSKTNK